jgi:hypothetical protein
LPGHGASSDMDKPPIRLDDNKLDVEVSTIAAIPTSTHEETSAQNSMSPVGYDVLYWVEDYRFRFMEVWSVVGDQAPRAPSQCFLAVVIEVSSQ